MQKYFLSATTLKSNKKDIPIKFLKTKEETEITAKERGYISFNLQLILFKKIGFRDYFVVWKVMGCLADE